MFKRSKNHDEQFGEFADVIERLQAERSSATPLELDEIKTRAMRRGARRRVGLTTNGGTMRRTLVIAMVTGSLLIGGTGAVLAGEDNGKGDGNDSGKGEYGCPPGTHGSNCKPVTCKNNGSNNQGQGNCQPKGSHGSHPGGGSHGNGNGNGHGDN